VPKFDAAGSHYAYRTGAAVGFWQAIKQSYRGSFAFLLACPLLALVPVAFELVQHMVEVHIGLYDSVEAAKARRESDPTGIRFPQDNRNYGPRLLGRALAGHTR